MLIPLAARTIAKLQAISAGGARPGAVTGPIDTARMNSFQDGTFFPTSVDLLSNGTVVNNIGYSFQMASDLKGNPILTYRQSVDDVLVDEIIVNSATATVQENITYAPSSVLNLTLTGYGSGPADEPFANGFGISKGVYTFGKKKHSIPRTKIVDFNNLDAAALATLAPLAKGIEKFVDAATIKVSKSNNLRIAQTVARDDNLMFYLPPLVGPISNLTQSSFKQVNPCSLCTPTVITLAGIFWETGAGAFVLGFCLGCELGGLF